MILAFYIKSQYALKGYKKIISKLEILSAKILRIEEKCAQLSEEIEVQKERKKAQEKLSEGVSDKVKRELLPGYDKIINRLEKEIRDNKNLLYEYRRDFEDLQKRYPWLEIGDNYQDFFNKSNQATIHIF